LRRSGVVRNDTPHLAQRVLARIPPVPHECPVASLSLPVVPRDLVHQPPRDFELTRQFPEPHLRVFVGVPATCFCRPEIPKFQGTRETLSHQSVEKPASSFPWPTGMSTSPFISLRRPTLRPPHSKQRFNGSSVALQR